MEQRTQPRENVNTANDRNRWRIASMEPRTHARGNLANQLSGRFVLLASMEPRTHARGNNGSGRWGWTTRKTLQWSHALTRVETPPRLTSRLHRAKLQWSHALTRVETMAPEECTRTDA